MSAARIAGTIRRHKQLRLDKAVKAALAAQGGMIYPGQHLDLTPFLEGAVIRERATP